MIDIFDVTGFRKTCPEAHNNFRFRHRVPPLKWSSKLSEDAQIWANDLAAGNKDRFELVHDPTLLRKGQGENLYFRKGPFAKRMCDEGEKGRDCLSCEKVVQVGMMKKQNMITAQVRARRE